MAGIGENRQKPSEHGNWDELPSLDSVLPRFFHGAFRAAEA